MNLRLPGKLLTILNLHIAGVAVLALLNLFLLGKLIFAWHDANAQHPEIVQQEQLTYKALELQTVPLRGLSGKVELARTDAANFYRTVFPPPIPPSLLNWETRGEERCAPHPRAVHAIPGTRGAGRDSNGYCA